MVFPGSPIRASWAITPYITHALLASPALREVAFEGRVLLILIRQPLFHELVRQTTIEVVRCYGYRQLVKCYLDQYHVPQDVKSLIVYEGIVEANDDEARYVSYENDHG